MTGRPAEAGRVLIVDDEATFARAVATRLARQGYVCRTAGALADARPHLAAGADWTPDLVLLDMRLPDGTGLELLDQLAPTSDAPAVIAVTAFGDIDNAVEAMKRGARDYLRKPVDLDDLVHAIERTLAAARLQTRLTYSRERDSHAVDPAELIGKSPAIEAVRRELATIAALAGDDGAPPPTVLLAGETGSGKDIAARLIHSLGPRADQPFVRIDCATLSLEAAERELFGESDAGAAPGLIEAAEGGSVFLDEIAELAPAVQARLLSVIERRRLRRPGGGREVAVAARFIAGTNRDLTAQVKAGAFRADLYYRLNVIAVRLPPLRERPGDATLLARHFAAAVARRYGRPTPAFAESALAMLERYPWPGNVRELGHLIERAVLLDSDGEIGPRDLAMPGPVVAAGDGSDPYAALKGMTVEGAERWLMARALERAGGNVSAAARALGLTRMALRYRMEKYGL